VNENGGSIVKGGRSAGLSSRPPNLGAVQDAASCCAPTVGSAAWPGARITSHKIGSNNQA
jgi:hypothetical protein